MVQIAVCIIHPARLKKTILNKSFPGRLPWEMRQKAAQQDGDDWSRSGYHRLLFLCKDQGTEWFRN